MIKENKFDAIVLSSSLVTLYNISNYIIKKKLTYCLRSLFVRVLNNLKIYAIYQKSIKQNMLLVS